MVYFPPSQTHHLNTTIVFLSSTLAPFGMQYKFSLCLFASAVVSTLALPTPGNSQVVSELLTASTALDRLDVLSSDTDFLFDFFNPPPAAISASTQNGHTVAANRDTFPAVVGNGVSMTVGFLGPCGLNTPHTHPRATEFNIAINGTLEAGMLEENGARFIMNTLNPGQATLFPRGAIHFEQNLGCETVMFVAAFSDEDPGVSQLTNLFNLPIDIVEAVLGMAEAEVQQLIAGLPKNVALGVNDCLKACGFQ